MQDEINAALRRAGFQDFLPVSSIEMKPGPAALRAHGDLGGATIPRARWSTERGSEVEAPELRAAGFRLSRLDDDQDVLRIVDERGQHRISALLAEGPVELLEGERFLGVRLSTLRGPRPIVISTKDRQSVVVVTETELHLLAPAPLEVKPDAEVCSEARRWARETDDTWLIDAVEEALSGEGPLAETIAAGLTCRLAPIPFDPSEVRAEARAIVAGKASSRPAPARAWARGLTRDQAETIDRHALGAAERCLDEIRRLEEVPDPEDPHWRPAVLSALHERDDLEGVRLLLAEAGHHRVSRLTAALGALDDYGKTFALVIPGVAPEDDERLQRARAASPEGWWTLPGRWPGDGESDDWIGGRARREPKTPG